MRDPSMRAPAPPVIPLPRDLAQVRTAAAKLADAIGQYNEAYEAWALWYRMAQVLLTLQKAAQTSDSFRYSVELLGELNRELGKQYQGEIEVWLAMVPERCLTTRVAAARYGEAKVDFDTAYGATRDLQVDEDEDTRKRIVSSLYGASGTMKEESRTIVQDLLDELKVQITSLNELVSRTEEGARADA